MSITKEAMLDIALGRGGSYGLTRDVIKHVIWDTRYFGDAISDYTFFSNPIGTAWYQAAQKTKNETNMLDTGKLPNGQTFLIKRIGVSLVGCGNKAAVVLANLAQDFYDIIQHSVFEIRIAGREFDFQLHGRQFLPSIALSEEGTATLPGVRVGDVIASGWVSLDHIPIFVDQLVSFSVNMSVGSAVANINTVLDTAAAALNSNYSTLQCSLEGVLTRAK